MTILWRSQMSVGNKQVDQDHKYLLGLINTVELVILEQGGMDDLALVIDQLRVFAEGHFKRENELMERIGYPYRVDHIYKHNSLLGKLKNIHENMQDCSKAKKTSSNAGDIDAKMDDEVKKLVDLLRLWVIDDVIGPDREMKSYFEDKARADLALANN